MNTLKLLVSGLMLVSVLLSACVPAATTPVPTAISPPTAPNVAPTQVETLFTSSTFKVPLTLTYGSEWAVDSDTSDQLVVQDNNADIFVGFILVDAAKFYDPTDGHVISFPKDFLAWIKSDPDFSKIESMPVTVGGIPGTQIDAEPTTMSQKPFIMLKTDGWRFISVSDHVEHWRFIDLGEVKGQHLIILSIAPADQFQSLVPEAQKILDTVAFSEPTAFSSDKFKLPMSVTFGPDWSVAYDFPGKFAIDNSHGFGLSFYVVTDAKLIDPIDGHLIPFPEDFLSWIKSDPDFDAVKSTPVTVAGIEGLQIDATPVWKSTTAKLKAFLSLSGDVSLNLSHGQPDGENIVTDPEQWRFILLDNVNRERLLIVFIAPAEQFKDAIPQAQIILDSVAFTN